MHAVTRGGVWAGGLSTDGLSGICTSWNGYNGIPADSIQSELRRTGERRSHRSTTLLMYSSGWSVRAPFLKGFQEWRRAEPLLFWLARLLAGLFFRLEAPPELTPELEREPQLLSEERGGSGGGRGGSGGCTEKRFRVWSYEATTTDGKALLSIHINGAHDHW